MRTRRLSLVISAVIVTMAVAVAGWLVSPIGDAAGSRSAPAAAAPPRALRILVTNDDGVGAAGIDAVARALTALPNTQVDIIAPATNQSGTGDRTTSGPITVTDTTTASGLPARSVSGFPADTVLFGILQGLPERPDLIVSGSNAGQNIGAEIVNISGTDGAAFTAARLHVPAIAVSQGLASTISYAESARLTTNLVQFFRSSLLNRPPTAAATVINLNVPSCPSVRGMVVVPVGRVNQITGYTAGGSGSYTPTVNSRNINAVNCSSTATNPVDDIDGFNADFAPFSVLNPDQNAG